MGTSYRPDNPFAGGAGRKRYRTDNPFAREDEPSLIERAGSALRTADAAVTRNPVARTARTVIADVAATVPRVGSMLLEAGPHRERVRSVADRIEEWGRPRDAIGTGAKLLTGIGKYIALGPAYGMAVGAAEAAADPRFSGTSLVSELEKIERPGLAGDAARAVGRGAAWLNQTPVGRAVGDVAIGEIGGRLIQGAARGVRAGGRAVGRGVEAGLDRLNPIGDDVLDAAFRDPLPTSGRLTPDRFDEFAREIVQPPQRLPTEPRLKRLMPGRFELPADSRALTPPDDSWRSRMLWEQAGQPVSPPLRAVEDVMPDVGRRRLPSSTGGAWPMPSGGEESIAQARARLQAELDADPRRAAMLARAERIAANPPTSDDVLREVAGRERETDDLFRLQGARTAGGARRDVARVRTNDLVDELVELDQKRLAATERAQYAWVDDGETLHSTGSVVASADRRGADGVSRQAKALQNLKDFQRATDEIVGELEARGLSQEDIWSRVRAVDEARHGEARAVKARRNAANEARAASGGADPVARAEREALGGPEPEYQAGDGGTFDLFSVGSTPALVRGARAVAQSPAASAVAGAAVGATVDDESPMRGALTGAAIASGASALARRAARTGQPLRLTGDADIDAVLGTIARGEREARKPDALLTTARKAYTRVVDELYPLRAFGREVGGARTLSDVATQASGWRSSANQTVRDQLRPVLDATRGRREEVMALAKAQRALSLLDAGLEKTDIPRDVLERTVQKLGGDADVARGAQQLQDYYRQLLDYKRANGVLTQESYDAIVASGDFYTPFTREFDEAALRGGTGGGGRFVNRGSGVRRMDANAASAKTVDPFEQAVLDTFETHRTVAKQRVSNVLAATVEANDIAAHPFIRRVANQQAGKSGRVVAANIGGERRFYEVVDEDLYNAWASFDPVQQNLLVKIGAPFKRALQTGVTLLPDFAAANALRDNVMTALQYPLKSRSTLGGAAVGAAAGAATSDDPLKGAAIGAGLGLGVGGLLPNVMRTLGAMRSIVADDDVYRQWMRDGGGGFGGFYPRDTQSARKLLRELERGGVQASDVINPKRWVDALHYIGRVAEQGPRLAAYREALADGADAAGAVARSADISLDFSKIGTHTKGIAATTAFWNAKVQGWDKLARLLKNPKTWAQGAAMITAPSVALWAVNKDNPEYWERPQWERNLFWLIPKGGESGGFWRLPKPFEVGYLFASVPERILDYAHERDPETLAVALKDMLSTAADGSVPLLPTIAQPVVENMVNYSFFRNRPVVARPDLAPERQFDDRTSSVAKLAGEATGTSPQKIDNLISGYAGGAGKVVRDVTDRIARATGVDNRPLPPDRARVPVVGDMGRRFSTRDAGTSDAESMFWRRWERADQAYRTVSDMLNDGEDEADVRAFVREHREDLGAYEALKETRRELQEIRKAERELLANREMPDERKQRLRVKLRQLATQIASGDAGGTAVADRP